MNTIRYDKKYSKNVLHLYFKIASAMPLCNFRNKLLRIINEENQHKKMSSTRYRFYLYEEHQSYVFDNEYFIEKTGWVMVLQILKTKHFF